jgi:predicted nucleotidyltransferase
MPNRFDIYRQLIEVTAFLEEELGQAPIVYGSLGVELALQRDYDAHDIDLIIMNEADDHEENHPDHAPPWL